MKNVLCDNGKCNFKKLPSFDECFYFSSYHICHTLDNSGYKNEEDYYSTPVLTNLSRQIETSFPVFELVLSEEDIKLSSMIYMQPFVQYQYLGAKIEVTCTIIDSYVARPIYFGVKHTYSENITFYPTVDDARYNLSNGPQSIWSFSSYNISLDTTDIERIVCFAPIRASYDWINTSRPVSVYELSHPKLVIDPDYSASWNDTLAIEHIFMASSTNKSIVCNATGFPPPKISWTRSSIPVGSTEEGSFPSLLRRSVIPFKLVEKSMEGIYICKVENSQGEQQLFFNVVVKEKSSETIFVLSIIVPTIFVLVILIWIISSIWKRIKGRPGQKIVFLTEQEEQQFIYGSQGKCLRVPNACILQQPFDPKFIISRSSLKFDVKRILGSGQYGLVIDGWMCRGGNCDLLQVAIKTTKETTDAFHFKAFLSEVKISSNLNGHSNIVGFFGACIENVKNGEMYAAYEFCQHGDLRTVLRRRKVQLKNSEPGAFDQPLSLEVFSPDQRLNCMEYLFEWSRDIANGMTYLASNNIIYGDLATRNILITGENVAKISDFGLSKQLLHDFTGYLNKTKITFPWKWMAPESLLDSNFSLQSDVWSFGVTLWEIFSLGDSPFPGQNYDAKFIKAISEGMRPTQPQFASTELYNTMLRCWEKYPESRPTIASLFTDIEKFVVNAEQTIETEYAKM